MILTGNTISNIINGQLQPHGIDIKVTNVYYLINKDIDTKVTDDDYIPLDKFNKNNKHYWKLLPKESYLFQLEKTDFSKENLNSPVVGYVLPKSRYSRCGLIVHSALFDYGFVGAGKILVFNSSNRIQKIFEGTYFGQLIVFQAEKGDMVYNGTHNHEGLKNGDC